MTILQTSDRVMRERGYESSLAMASTYVGSMGWLRGTPWQWYISITNNFDKSHRKEYNYE